MLKKALYGLMTGFKCYQRLAAHVVIAIAVSELMLYAAGRLYVPFHVPSIAHWIVIILLFGLLELIAAKISKAK